MIKLDELFHRHVERLPDPRLRYCNEILQRPGTSATVEVFRPQAGIGLARPEISIWLSENGNTLQPMTLPWDDDFNAGLIQLRVRANSEEQEADRFSLALEAAMRRPAQEFGDGFFNSVLLEFVKQSDLLDYPPIAEVAKYAYALDPNTASKNYKPCREMIEDAITARALELKDTEKLNYNEEEAKRILLEALARYLDDRFTVSYRRRLGLL